MWSHLVEVWVFIFFLDVFIWGSHMAQTSFVHLVVGDGLKPLAFVPRVRVLACAIYHAWPPSIKVYLLVTRRLAWLGQDWNL